MATPIQLFKLRTVRGTGSSSSGDVQYFETQEGFEKELMLALIETLVNDEASGSVYRRDRDTWRVWYRLLDALRQGETPEGYTYKRVLGAWKLVEGAWVALSLDIVPPVMHWALDFEAKVEG